MNNVIIKKATSSNVEALRQIAIEAYSKSFKNHWIKNGLELYLDKEFNIKRLTQELNGDHYNWFFISLANKNIGFIKVGLTAQCNLNIEADCELIKVYILPQYKGQGFGKLALLKIIEKMKALGKKMLVLDVVCTNKTAIKFYQSLGFKIYNEFQFSEPFFKDELRGMYKMALKLD